MNFSLFFRELLTKKQKAKFCDKCGKPISSGNVCEFCWRKSVDKLFEELQR